MLPERAFRNSVILYAALHCPENGADWLAKLPADSRNLVFWLSYCVASYRKINRAPKTLTGQAWRDVMAVKERDALAIPSIHQDLPRVARPSVA